MFNGEFSFRKVFTVTAFFVLTFLPSAAFAEEAAAVVDKADTAWILVATALVMLMTPGLALFYAGMARKKNVLGTMMHSFFILCLVSVLWVVYGYSLSFGTDLGGIIGGIEHVAFNGVDASAKGTIPHMLFAIFQGMFAVITVALITGAIAERVKFSAIAVFSVLWLTLVYVPLCHWVWGGGWLSSVGVLDFAGGIVVHISCGVSALVAALVVGKRRGYLKEHMPPHSLPLTLAGMGILWFGWFGFNAGSALSANAQAVLAFVTTNTAASVAALAWVFIEWAHRGKPTLLGAISGAVAGLGSITPAAGYVGVGSSMAIGLVAGTLCYIAVSIMKPKTGYDDTLDVFGIHGVAGTWGTLSVGLFASVGATGLFFGSWKLLLSQFIGAGSAIVFSAVATYAIVRVVDAAIGMRVTTEDEVEGLDVSQHGESGYTW